MPTYWVYDLRCSPDDADDFEADNPLHAAKLFATDLDEDDPDNFPLSNKITVCVIDKAGKKTTVGVTRMPGTIFIAHDETGTNEPA